MEYEYTKIAKQSVK